MARPFSYNPPPDKQLEILHHDDEFVVLNKPSRLLSVPGKIEAHSDCLERRARQKFAGARIVHRLDMDTSGVMVLALNPKAHRHLGLQFERRHVEKTYIAEVWGVMAGDDGVVDFPLICDWPNRPKQIVDHDRGKSAKTNWHVLERKINSTLVQLKPETGRSHQLRVHMLCLGHPVLGDNLYAHDDALKAADRLHLHAQDLGFFHPDGGKRMDFHAPCPFK